MNESPVVFGRGNQVRDFIYVGDVVKLHNEMPEGSTLSLDKKKITKESMEKWTLKSKEKWESNK